MNNSGDVILSTTPLVHESVGPNSGCLRSGQEVSLVALAVVDLRVQVVMSLRSGMVLAAVDQLTRRAALQLGTGLFGLSLPGYLAASRAGQVDPAPVSNTHLTLPTILLV